MSVFTTVTFEQLKQWLQAYPLGELLDLQGISAGITNTNYFVTTSSGRYVLTLFEEHTAEELPYFLNLMSHLAMRGVPCPHPVESSNGTFLDELNGKPAALVSCLRGSDLETPSAENCAEVGRVLAGMHIAGQSFEGVTRNPRGEGWRLATAEKVSPFLDAGDKALLEQAMALDIDTAQLPTGVIHADLFRDNVLFDSEHLGGLIDFYYACNDVLLYDVAIAVNDWCTAEGYALDEPRTTALLQAYHSVRPFTAGEQSAWPVLLQLAALRFWLSRLHDKYFPHAGELTHAKDPDHFRHILHSRLNDGVVALR
jgi:homoserine kinase type II